MNEIDLAVAIRDTSDSGSMHFMNFVTGLFAFVLASHFVGAHLSRINAAILVGIFTAFSAITNYAVVARFRMVENLYVQLSSIPDPELRYISFPATGYGTLIISSVMFVAYIGGLAFLFETRRRSASPLDSPAAGPAIDEDPA